VEVERKRKLNFGRGEEEKEVVRDQHGRGPKIFLAGIGKKKKARERPRRKAERKKKEGSSVTVWPPYRRLGEREQKSNLGKRRKGGFRSL